jgi:hypothetical protein
VSNFTCSNDPQFPVKPRFIDYYIVDTSSTLEGWTYLTRRTSPAVVDAFNLTVRAHYACSKAETHTHTTPQLPEGYWATGQATGATYALRPLVIYPDPAHAGLLDTYTHPYDAVPLQISGN